MRDINVHFCSHIYIDALQLSLKAKPRADLGYPDIILNPKRSQNRVLKA